MPGLMRLAGAGVRCGVVELGMLGAAAEVAISRSREMGAPQVGRGRGYAVRLCYTARILSASATIRIQAGGSGVSFSFSHFPFIARSACIRSGIYKPLCCTCMRRGSGYLAQHVETVLC